jgi:transposase
VIPPASGTRRCWPSWLARARRKIPELEAAVEGAEFFTAEHAALLATMLARIDRLTEVIERLLAPYEEQLQQAESMPGWGRRAAQDAVAETGVEMSRFPTGAHLASWAGRTPLDHQSGRRTGRAKSKKGNRYLAGITGETAVAAGKTQTREGARYRRLARRRGKAKAQVALGNTQLKVYHKLLSNPGLRYQVLGPDYYERQAGTRRQIAHHVGKLGDLGFEVTLCLRPDPEPQPDATGHTKPPDPQSAQTHPGSAALRRGVRVFSCEARDAQYGCNAYRCCRNAA